MLTKKFNYRRAVCLVSRTFVVAWSGGHGHRKPLQELIRWLFGWRNVAGDLLPILVAGPLLDRRNARTARKLRVLIPEPKAIAAAPHTLKRSNLLGGVEVGTPSQDDGFDLIVLDSAMSSAHPEFSSWLNEGGCVLTWDTVLHEADRLDQLFTAGLRYYSPHHSKSRRGHHSGGHPGHLDTNICRTSIIQIGQSIRLTRWC